jgi:hypothetical protein
MATLSVRSRVAGLQVQIGRIESLAFATLNLIDDLESQADAVTTAHLTNYVDLIIDVARRLRDEAEEIEKDVPSSIATRVGDMTTSNDRAEWEKAETAYREAWALWDTLPDDYSNEEADAIQAVAWPAMRKLIDTPAPDAAAMLVKMVSAWEGGLIVTEGDKEALIADATRLAAQREG